MCLVLGGCNRKVGSNNSPTAPTHALVWRGAVRRGRWVLRLFSLAIDQELRLRFGGRVVPAGGVGAHLGPPFEREWSPASGPQSYQRRIELEVRKIKCVRFWGCG
jgi:hypothetical protein